MWSRNQSLYVVLTAPLAFPVALALAASDANDYPTSARADYVFACMKTNGDTRQVLEQCSCSIDVIASILPYERYVTAEIGAEPGSGSRRVRRDVPDLRTGKVGRE